MNIENAPTIAEGVAPLAELGGSARLAPSAARNIARVVDRIEQQVALALNGAPGPLKQATEQLLHAGGKRVRPKLVVLSAMAAGRARRGVVHLAIAAEVVHSATLLHDDVVDSAPVRRGEPSAAAAFGNSLAVLAGDHLFAVAIDLVLRSRHARALPELIRAIRLMVQAEAKQLSQRQAPEIDEALSIRICLDKTASLFRWCGAAGAIAAGASPAVEAALAGFGEQIGLAFQFVDDVLDLSAENGIGEDLEQGAITLPMVLACRKRPEIAAEIREAQRLVGERGDLPAETRRTLSKAILATGADHEAMARAQHHTARALRFLACLPESPHREALGEMAQKLAHRAV
jgi:octaprenyl-diphosphate synthase